MRFLLLLLMLISTSAGEVTTTSTALFERVLKLQHIQEPELDDDAMAAAFTAVVEATRAALTKAADTDARIAALNTSLLASREVGYLSNQYWRDSTLAASLLRRQGNCLATSTLYVLVADALSLPIKPVMVPGHIFVRWEDGLVRRNIETTAKGEHLSDDDYLYRDNPADPADVAALGWGRSLDHDAFFAELVECAAQHRVGEGRLADAQVLLEEAERLAPARSDRVLAHIQLRSDLTKDRTAARLELTRLLNHGNPPPSVATNALMMLAKDAAGRGDPDGQRTLLLMAFKHAPKSELQSVLRELAFCCRTLRDSKSARRYLELSIVLIPDGSPELADELYNLAILQKSDQDLEAAIATIRRGRGINPESWNLQMLEAGYLILIGQRAAGEALRTQVVKPRGEEELWLTMEAWYLAVIADRDGFFAKLTELLERSDTVDTLIWIDQDEILDPYRKDPRFVDLLRIHRQRLGASAPSAPAASDTPAPKTVPSAVP